MMNFRSLHLAAMLLGLLSAWEAGAAVVLTVPATLSKALVTTPCGDTLSLAAGGGYGDAQIRRLCPADKPLTLTSADPANHAVLRSVSVYASSGISLDLFDVSMAPTALTLSNTPAVGIRESSHVSATRLKIASGPAVSGVLPTAAAQDKTGNVIGFPTGYGVFVYLSDHVTVASNHVSQVDRGIVLSSASDTVVDFNDIGFTRRTSIIGSVRDNVAITRNHTHDINPWSWGVVGTWSDHADHALVWVDAAQTVPSAGLVISGNLMEQGKGTAVSGIEVQSNARHVGFLAPQVTNNVLYNGQGLGLFIEDSTDGQIGGNVLIQSSGSAPLIRIQTGTKRFSITGNTVSLISDVSGSTGADANLQSGNDDTLTGVQPASVARLARRLVVVP